MPGKKKNYIKQYIFVVGCPRSGTTLLQRLLLSIEGSFSIPESNFFKLLPNNYYVAPRSLPPFLKYRYPAKLNIATVQRIIISMKKYSGLIVPLSDEKRIYDNIEHLDVKNLFNYLVTRYQDSGVIFIEKTPNHIFHVDYIKRVFPESLIICIVRDPRDNYVSYRNFLMQQNKLSRSAAEYCHIWKKTYNYAIKNGLIIVKYEDLIDQPIQTINYAIASKGLSIYRIVDCNSNNIIMPNETWKSNTGKDIMRGNYGKYCEELSEYEISEINRRCKKEMDVLGYAVESGNNLFYSVAYVRNSLYWYLVYLVLLLKSIINIFILKRH